MEIFKTNICMIDTLKKLHHHLLHTLKGIGINSMRTKYKQYILVFHFRRRFLPNFEAKKN